VAFLVRGEGVFERVERTATAVLDLPCGLARRVLDRLDVVVGGVVTFRLLNTTILHIHCIDTMCMNASILHFIISYIKA